MILNAYRGVCSIKSRHLRETKIIRKAFNLALNAHRDVRKSETLHISSLAVAAEMK